MKFDENRGKEVPNPSAQKSEAGAIERIELYGASDKRKFSVEEAVAWLSNPMTGSGYEVKLFDVVPTRSEWDRLDDSHRRLVESLLSEAIGCGELGINRDPRSAFLSWGIVARPLHGQGLGKFLTQARLDLARARPEIEKITLNTRQHSQGFYATYRFKVKTITLDGYSRGLDRGDMVLHLR